MEAGFIEAVERLAAAAERIADALASAPAKKAPKKSPPASDRKPGTKEVTGAIESWADLANSYGWFKGRVNNLEVSTKSTTLAAAMTEAWKAGAQVRITYDEAPKGNFTNRYIATVDVVDDPAPNALPATIEDDDCPF